jgi:hypothetical protein
MGILNNFILSVVFLVFSQNAFTKNCYSIEDNFNSTQFLINVIENSGQFEGNFKKIHSEENVTVDGLSKSMFLEIGHDPKKIAAILGAQILEEKSNTEFKIAIPGILGFDLNFWVRLNFVGDNQIHLEMDQFNTFLESGKGTLTFTSDGDVGHLEIVGDAFVPNASTNMLIFGLGGKNNFQSLLQKEIDQQITKSIERFKNLNE